MSSIELDLNIALKRLLEGNASKIDIESLVEGIAVGDLRLQRTISVGRDVINSILVVGDGNLITLSIENAALLTHVEYKPPHKPPKGKLPSSSGLPPASRMIYTQNALFTGRVDELRKLADSLLYANKSISSSTSQVVQGMGGIGKTQLAVEFVYRYGRFFKGVHWINGAISTDLVDEIVACGELMNLQPWPETPRIRMQITIEAWKASGPRLVILDNFDQVEEARDWLSQLYHPNICILITSRQSDWPDDLGLQILSLAEFAKNESYDFFRKYLSESRANDEDIHTLSIRLGHLPLALELAGRYLKSIPNLKVKDYINQLTLDHPSLKDWRKDKGNPTKHELDIAQTFALSWEKIDSPLAKELFIAAGYFSPNIQIPKAVLELTLGNNDKFIPSDESLSMLIGLSLIKPEIIIHPLLSEFAKLQDADNKILFAWARALTAYSQPNAPSGGIHTDKLLIKHLNFALPHLLKAAYLKKDDAAETLKFHLAFILSFFGELTTALKLYEHVASNIDEDLDAKGKSAVLHQMANIYVTQGNFEKALLLYEQALRIDEKENNLLDKAKTQGAIANIQIIRGDLDVSLENYTQAYEIFLRAEDYYNLSIVSTNMAYIYRTRGDLDSALELYNFALEIQNKRGDGKEKASILHEMSSIYFRRGELDKAQNLLETAFEIFDNLGDLHSKGNVLNAIGNIYSQRDDHEKAIMLFNRAYEIMNATGDERGKAISLVNIAHETISLGKLEQGMQSYTQALEIAEKLGDVETKASILFNIARVHYEKDEYDKALDIYQQVLLLNEAIGDLRGKAVTLGEISSIYINRKDYEKALQLVSLKLNIVREVEDKREEAVALGTVANINWHLKYYSEAINYLMIGLFILMEREIAPDTQNSMIENLYAWRREIGQDKFDDLWKETMGGIPLPPSPSDIRDQVFEEFIEEIVEAAIEDSSKRGQYYKLIKSLINSSDEIERNIGSVLRIITEGNFDPDLSSLPSELAETIRNILNRKDR